MIGKCSSGVHVCACTVFLQCEISFVFLSSSFRIYRQHFNSWSACRSWYFPLIKDSVYISGIMSFFFTLVGENETPELVHESKGFIQESNSSVSIYASASLSPARRALLSIILFLLWLLPSVCFPTSLNVALLLPRQPPTTYIVNHVIVPLIIVVKIVGTRKLSTYIDVISIGWIQAHWKDLIDVLL